MAAPTANVGINLARYILYPPLATWSPPSLPSRSLFFLLDRQKPKTHGPALDSSLHFGDNISMITLRALICGLGATMAIDAVARPMILLLDPGHGGKDRGTVHNSMEECDIVLKIALKLEERLRGDPQFKVVMTRKTDHFVPLAARAGMARHVHADVLISLHLNSSTEKKAKGAEFYFQNQLPPDEQTMFLAAQENLEDITEMSIEESLGGVRGVPPDKEVRLILDDLVHNDRVRKSSELVKSLIAQWRGGRKSLAYSVKQAPFHVISEVNMPSALVEIGFLTNAEEAQHLASNTFQTDIARGIYRGLVNFKEFIDSREHAL
jgi:N-acetylmuramoyl-L-alanine amidase